MLRGIRNVVLARTGIPPYCSGEVALYAFNGKKRNLKTRLSDCAYALLKSSFPWEQEFNRRVIREVRPDYIHAHYAVNAAYYEHLRVETDAPLILSCYGYDVSSFPNRYLGYGARYLRKAWNWASVVLAMSDDMRTDLIRLGCPPEKIRIHYHGIDLSQFEAASEAANDSQVRILYAGSLGDERKGIEFLLGAFAAAASIRPGIVLRIIGEGAMRPRYEQLARRLGIGSQVEFTGFVPHEEIAREMRTAQIFCHPSLTTKSGDKEGIPGTIVEAMAMGLPVVATRHAGIPEMVLHQITGVIVPERDTRELADALVKLIDDPVLRRKLGNAGIERARLHADASRQAAELLSIYRSLP